MLPFTTLFAQMQTGFCCHSQQSETKKSLLLSATINYWGQWVRPETHNRGMQNPLSVPRRAADAASLSQTDRRTQCRLLFCQMGNKKYIINNAAGAAAAHNSCESISKLYSSFLNSFSIKCPEAEGLEVGRDTEGRLIWLNRNTALCSETM